MTGLCLYLGFGRGLSRGGLGVVSRGALVCGGGLSARSVVGLWFPPLSFIGPLPHSEACPR